MKQSHAAQLSRPTFTIHLKEPLLTWSQAKVAAYWGVAGGILLSMAVFVFGG